MQRSREKRKPADWGRRGFLGISKSGQISEKTSIAAPSPTRQARWQEANPLKRWAHIATASAIRRGLLVRPDKCDQCGTAGPVDAHHDPDRYAEPLHISAWLCRSCHVRHHVRRRKAGVT